MNLLARVFGFKEESKFNFPKYESDFLSARIALEDEWAKRRKENKDKIKELSLNLDKFGTTSKIDWIEGKDLHDFILKNWYMNGDQLFEVVNKETGDRFLAHYYATENSFVNPLNSDEWFYDKESVWENQLDNYKAIPVFINYK